MHRKRHPFFENLVFGLAALLALVILVGAGRRFLGAGSGSSSRPVASGTASAATAGFGQEVPEGGSLRASYSEQSVPATPAAAVSFGSSERSKHRAPSSVPLP